MKINNSISLGLSRQLKQSQSMVSKALERLSTGRRINSARDGLADFSRLQTLEASQRGLQQSILGLNQVRGLVETTEASLSSLTEIVQQMREISVQASSSLLGAQERKALGQQLMSLRDEFSRIVHDTRYGDLLTLNSTKPIEILDDTPYPQKSLLAGEFFTREVNSGIFTDTESLQLDISGLAVRSLIQADLNNNGRTDILAIGSGGQIQVLLNNGQGSFQKKSVQTLAASGGVKIGDFNGNGIKDIVAGSSLYLGQGDGSFSFHSTFAGSALDVADINGNGIDDLVVKTSSTQVQILLGQGEGVFEAGATFSTTGIIGGALFGDFNGDGKVNLVLSDTQIRFYDNDGQGNFSFVKTSSVGMQTSLGRVQDVNGNGHLDILDLSTGSATWLMNDGTGSFSAGSASIFPSLSLTSIPMVGDLNGDGKPDVFISDRDLAPGLYIKFGNAQVKNLLPGFNAASTEISDIRGQGILDLLAVTSSGELKIMRGFSKEISALSKFGLETAEEASDLIEVFDRSLEKLLTTRGDYARLLQKTEIRSNHALLLSESLQQAQEDLGSADFAQETSKLVGAQILQQAQIAALSQSNLQMQAVLQLFSNL